MGAYLVQTLSTTTTNCMLEGWGVWVMRPENDEHSVSSIHRATTHTDQGKNSAMGWVGADVSVKQKRLELSSGKETRRI